jgi:large repetitive protein
VFGASATFLQNSRPLLHGRAPAGATVRVEIDSAHYTVEADGEGYWRFVPPAPLPVGMNWVRARVIDPAASPADAPVSQILQIAPAARAVASPAIIPLLVDGALLTNTPILSGNGPPGWLLHLQREDAAGEESEFLGETVIDLNGRWSLRPETPLAPGEHKLWAMVVDAEGTPLALSQPVRVRIASNARSLRPPEVTPLFATDSAEATSAGELLVEALMGTATPSALLLLYVDGESVDRIRVGSSGEWRYIFDEAIPGRTHDVRLVEVDSNGAPLAISGPLVLPLQGFGQGRPAP